jgi:Co/Zn/Cd efflux system component
MTTITVLRDALAVLMESAPQHVSTEAVVRDLISIPGVSDIHSLRIWALKLDSTAISVHLDIEPTLLLNVGGEKAEQEVEIMGNIVGEAHRRLHSRHHIEFITVQVQCRPLARRERTKSGEEDTSVGDENPADTLTIEAV